MIDLRRPTFVPVCIVLLLGLSGGPIRGDDSVLTACKEGTINADVRYRYEDVDEEGFDEDAEASTVRLRLGYETGSYRGFSAYADLEAVATVGSEKYDSTANGKGQFPAVFDPEDEELNQLWLAYAAPWNTTLKLGRQRIKLDNDRFVGNVGFRQNEQTFDAFSIKGAPRKRFSFFLAHVNNANRIFGENHPVPARADQHLSAELLNLAFELPIGTLTGYAYFLELEDTPDDSHKNIGLRLTGKRELSDHLKLLYTAERADQSDYEDGLSTVDAGYLLAELGLNVRGVTVKGGYEVLEGDGTYGFQTPLATLHAHNGWADRFAGGTPDTGLEDSFLSISGSVAGFTLKGIYHDFNAETGGADYGDELNLYVGRKLGENCSVSVKFADYDADSGSGGGAPDERDVRKLWLTLRAWI